MPAMEKPHSRQCQGVPGNSSWAAPEINFLEVAGVWNGRCCWVMHGCTLPISARRHLSFKHSLLSQIEVRCSWPFGCVRWTQHEARPSSPLIVFHAGFQATVTNYEQCVPVWTLFQLVERCIYSFITSHVAPLSLSGSLLFTKYHSLRSEGHIRVRQMAISPSSPSSFLVPTSHSCHMSTLRPVREETERHTFRHAPLTCIIIQLHHLLKALCKESPRDRRFHLSAFCLSLHSGNVRRGCLASFQQNPRIPGTCLVAPQRTPTSHHSHESTALVTYFALRM